MVIERIIKANFGMKVLDFEDLSNSDFNSFVEYFNNCEKYTLIKWRNVYLFKGYYNLIIVVKDGKIVEIKKFSGNINTYLKGYIASRNG